jgi:RNA-directed DNA polymerase
LQRALYRRAKNESHFRAYAIYDKVHRPDILAHAYACTRANGGAPGPDGVTFEEIEASGRDVLLEELREELTTKIYRPGPVRRVYIPKLNGGERPLGIPNIRDRVVQTAVTLLLEPLFEADFEPDSYGFRPRRAAHDALDAIREALEAGMYWVIDADVTAYFDTIPHDRLMKTVAQRVVDRAMLALVKRTCSTGAFVSACNAVSCPDDWSAMRMISSCSRRIVQIERSPGFSSWWRGLD